MTCHRLASGTPCRHSTGPSHLFRPRANRHSAVASVPLSGHRHGKQHDPPPVGAAVSPQTDHGRTLRGRSRPPFTPRASGVNWSNFAREKSPHMNARPIVPDNTGFLNHSLMTMNAPACTNPGPSLTDSRQKGLSPISPEYRQPLDILRFVEFGGTMTAPDRKCRRIAHP